MDPAEPARRSAGQENPFFQPGQSIATPPSHTHSPASPVNTDNPTSPGQQFLFVCCQVGAESTCKREIQERYPALRPAFSRPGFITFKCDPAIQPGSFHLVSTFARTWGWSLGRTTGDDIATLAGEVVQKSGTAKLPLVHCWQRNQRVPGDDGFEPGISPLAELAGQSLLAASAAAGHSPDLNRRARPGERVLDVVLVEPGEWWFGWHSSETVPQSWPGGVPPVEQEGDRVSRAWLKISEAVLWGQVPIRAGDAVAEVGSAPGGAAQFLLERGAIVVAIDPAELDPAVAAHPNLTHIRRRAKDVPRRDLADIRWLVVDVNMPPNYTLDVIEDYVSSPHLHVRGIIATLKLSEWELAAEAASWRERVRKLGFADVRTRQLAFNRQEICLVALKNRFERRLSRGRGGAAVPPGPPAELSGAASDPSAAPGPIAPQPNPGDLSGGPGPAAG